MIKIITVGKLKESYLNQAKEEYLKRLSKYTKIQIIEVADENNQEIALKKEAERILKYIKDSDYVITLEIEGNLLSSEEFASKIDQTLIQNSNITFIIGGSYGLDNSIKSLSNYKISFSKLTFPHQLFRIMLLEQIYRSFKIINHETYHKWKIKFFHFFIKMNKNSYPAPLFK